MGKVITYCQIWFAIGFFFEPAYSQPLRTAGTHFVFSIPEDAVNIGNTGGSPKLLLHVVSPYDGSGTLQAPNGVNLDFTFKPNIICEIALPRTLIHTRLPGKARIGISVQTTAPVNLVLHDLLDFAGEATQIWPVENLGKEYVVGSWGIFDDVNEHNHAQIAITPAHDETAVSITPSARTIDGLAKDSTFTVLLHRGDSYILKADSSTAGVRGLSGTRITASSPVSLMTAVTCAYVPLKNQACNMLLDNVLPTQYAGTEFYASPLGDTVREAYLLFTAAEKTYTITLSDGRTITSSNGRAVVPIGRPVRCLTTAPAFCHLLTPGSSTVLISDPSIVTILPVQHYQDTLLWYVPNILNGGMPFYHTVNVIGLTSSFASIVMDNKPIATLGNQAVIAGTEYSVAQVVTAPGIHTLRSRQPVFAVASGFFTADAYSFLPMSVGFRASEVSHSAEYDLNIAVHPNPASKTLTLTVVGIDSNIELTIFNALGNTVRSMRGTVAELQQIDIASLPAGTYTLEVSSGTHRGRTRFVISQ